MQFIPRANIRTPKKECRKFLTLPNPHKLEAVFPQVKKSFDIEYLSKLESFGILLA
jgi:hypothetical protein